MTKAGVAISISAVAAVIVFSFGLISREQIAWVFLSNVVVSVISTNFRFKA